MENRQEVFVTNIKMPFTSMVVFMIKWAIASIPAFIILSIIFGLISLFFGGFMTGLHHMGRGI
jgi:ABC-type multidrug transport system permease subunit